MSSTLTTSAAPAANLEIADALLHPGPRSGERSLRPASAASAESVKRDAEAWKAAEERESPPVPGPSSSFFQESKNVKVAKSTFTNVAANGAIHHHTHHHYHLYSYPHDYASYEDGSSSGDSEYEEGFEDVGAHGLKAPNSSPKPKTRRLKTGKRQLTAPQLTRLSKTEPFRSLKVPKRSSQEALTPIDLPRVQMPMSDYPRMGNLSQPELSILSRDLLARNNENVGQPQNRRTRKKIILSARQVPQVAPPTAHVPTDEDLYTAMRGRQVINHNYLKIHFWREGRLSVAQALLILNQATNLFDREPNLVSLKSPVTVSGDIHGQYYDLMQIFNIGGSIEKNQYVFLGNYINHGFFGIETILYLYALKLCYPNQLVLLRGSHESREVSEFFHFRTECLLKYSEEVYEACLRSFCSLPLAALVDDRLFCVHGGISPQLHRTDKMNIIQRPADPAMSGLLCDLLWSEPSPEYETKIGSEVGKGRPASGRFSFNTNQGRGHYYSYSAVCDFLARNNLYTVIRGNDIQKFGYKMHQATPNRDFPSIITLFSAPNHLDKHGNLGAILQYKKGSSVIKTFEESPHPYWLPNFSNAFAWSLPFVNTLFTEMLSAIMNIDDSNVDLLNFPVPMRRPLVTRKGIIRKKILAVGRFAIVMRESREQSSESNPRAQVTLNGVAWAGEQDRIDNEVREIPRNPETVPMLYTEEPVPSLTTGSRQNSMTLQARTDNSSQINKIWRRIMPKNRTDADSSGVEDRRAIIKAKIKAIGKWQRLWKSSRNPSK